MSENLDLQPFDFPPFAGHPALRAVGWLDAREDYSRGPVDRSVFDMLCELLINPWQPFVAMGGHECTFCRFTGGPMQIYINNQAIRIGAANLFVPADDCVFVSPSTIIHYIDAHEYSPPDVFVQAVLNCPPMCSMEYFHAIRKHISVKPLHSPE